MKRLSGTRSALICVSVGLIGHMCVGQIAPPPPPAPATVPPAQAVPPAASTATGETVPLQNEALPAKDLPAKDLPAKEAPAATPADEAPKDVKTPPPTGEGAVRIPEAAAAGSGTKPLGKPYVIGALDVLEVKIWKAGNLNGIYAVGQDGAIAVPLLGRIQADGLTEDQVASAIRDRLSAKVFVEPPDLSEITVTVVRNNSKKYYVFGSVGRQGEFPLLSSMTVMDALASCGGFLPFAKQTKIVIQRNGKEIKFNFKEVSHNKKMDQNIQIQNGDRIFVPE